MKPRRTATPASRKRSGGGTLLGLFIGLVIGVLIAAGVVWYIFKTPAPFVSKAPPAPSNAPAAAPAQAAPAPGSATTPMALPGKPGDPVPANGEKPRFDFYKILPGNADAIPDPQQAEGKPHETKTPETKSPEAVKEKSESALKEPVYLQTGSFQSAADADGQKARLALMGVEASVQQVMLQDKVWYRVRLGPFKKVDDVNAMRSDLAKQGIDANIVKKD